VKMDVSEQSSRTEATKHLSVMVAIAAYNEEKYIGSIVLKAKQYADQVIVLDDGSSDQTTKVAMLAGAVVIRHANNYGKGASLQDLLNEAKSRQVDVLILLDGDAQHNPDEIPLIMRPIKEGYDLVIGSRQAQARRTPFYRRLGQRVLRYSNRVLSKTRVTDTESGFRALSRKAVAEISLTENGFAVETEMISIAMEKGLKITEVPISNIYTHDGSTLNPVVHGLGILGRIVILISQRRPLFFFGLGGMLLSIIGLFIGYRVLDTSLQGRGLALGSALLSAILIIIGILSIFVGVILNALKRFRT
jgi:glycosyltransferase involved in cell wall biosynthesis